jgi:hypothetical protein
MKKHLFILSALIALLFSIESKAAAPDFHKKSMVKKTAHQVTPPLSEDDLFRLKAFKAFAQARRHHFDMMAAKENAGE